MAERMIWCPKCNRMVCFKQRGYRVYCAECGQEITYSSRKMEENVSPQHDSVSPKLENTIGGKIPGQGAGGSFTRESPTWVFHLVSPCSKVCRFSLLFGALLT